ncbi:hypothetical protein [Mucilaginibacter sp.]|uniref:hypothetical protein n=1 Tax=Mucilaginibacter sp. TaxID=1882438 RepID=UPI00326502CC
MKRKAISKEKCAQVKGKRQASRQRIREAPRQKIRQLLRSFIPLDELMQQTKSDQI